MHEQVFVRAKDLMPGDVIAHNGAARHVLSVRVRGQAVEVVAQHGERLSAHAISNPDNWIELVPQGDKTT